MDSSASAASRAGPGEGYGCPCPRLALAGAFPLQRHRVAQHHVMASLGGELNLCVPEFDVVVVYLGERLITEPLQCPGRVRESLEKIVVGSLGISGMRRARWSAARRGPVASRTHRDVR